MSAAKHTPGPWMPALASLSKGVRIYTVASEGRTRAGQEIAFVPNPSGQPSGTPFDMLPDQVKADANLIAAAPELLEACTAYLTDRAEAGCTADSAAVRRMRAAIAKATGSQQ